VRSENLFWQSERGRLARIDLHIDFRMALTAFQKSAMFRERVTVPAGETPALRLPKQILKLAPFWVAEETTP